MAKNIVYNYWVKRISVSFGLLCLIFFTCFIVVSNFYKRKHYTKSNLDIVLNKEDFISVQTPQEAKTEKSLYFNSSQVGAYFFTKAFQKINVKAANIISMENGTIFLDNAAIAFKAPTAKGLDPCSARAAKVHYVSASRDFNCPSEVKVTCASGNFATAGEISGSFETMKMKGNKGINIKRDNIKIKADNFSVNHIQQVIRLEGNVRVEMTDL